MHDQLPPITVKAAYEQQNFQYSYTLDSQPVAFAVPDPATAETFAVYTDRYGDPTLVSSDTLLGVSERSFENPPVWKNIRRDGETLTYRHLAYAETLYEKGQTSLSRIQYYEYNLSENHMPDYDDGPNPTQLIHKSVGHIGQPFERILADFSARTLPVAIEAFAQVYVDLLNKSDTCPACLCRMRWISDWGDYDCPGAY